MPAQPSQRTRRFFSGREAFRLLSLIVMLTIIGMTIYRFKGMTQPPVAATRDAESLPAAIAPLPQPPEGAEPATPEVPLDAAEVKPVTPEETAAFKSEVQAVLDLATAIHPTEMPAYNRLLDWSLRLPPDVAKEAAEVRFHDLIKKPDANRGKLIRVRLTVRRVLAYDLPSDVPDKLRKVYELWGWPVAADGWLYVVVTPELPPGFPPSGNVDETVEVCGYFFKLQGYQPGRAKPGAKSLAAPLLIGRVTRMPRAVPPSSPGFSPLALGGIFAALALIAAVWAWSQRSRWKLSARRADGLPERAELSPRSEVVGDSVGAPDQLKSNDDENHEEESERESARLDFDWLRDK